MAPGVPPMSDLTPMGASLSAFASVELSAGGHENFLFSRLTTWMLERDKASGDVAPRAREKLPRERAESYSSLH